jgi:hypothetical protein
VQEKGSASQNHCGNQTSMATRTTVDTMKRIQSIVEEEVSVAFIVLIVLLCGKSSKAT